MSESLIVPDVAELNMLKIILNVNPASNVALRLYSNELTLDGDTILADFTECPGGTGYAAKTLASGSWAISTDGLNKGYAEYASEQEFTFTVAQDIYGYFVTNAAGTELLWAQQAAYAPVELPSGGGLFSVHPKFTLVSENNS